MKQTLGSYLKSVRKAKSFSLRAVEDKTGISNAYLSQVENNKIRKPSPEVLHKLSNFYQISYERLMDLAGHPLPIISSQHWNLKPSFRLNNDFEELTEEEKKRVLEYIEFLKSRRM